MAYSGKYHWSQLHRTDLDLKAALKEINDNTAMAVIIKLVMSDGDFIPCQTRSKVQYYYIQVCLEGTLALSLVWTMCICTVCTYCMHFSRFNSLFPLVPPMFPSREEDAAATARRHRAGGLVSSSALARISAPCFAGLTLAAFCFSPTLHCHFLPFKVCAAQIMA